MYAIIATGGKQYKVQEGEVIRVEKVSAEPENEVVFDKVLFIGGEKPALGTPFVANAKVTGKVIRNAKAKKVIVFHRRRRKGFHKKYGHRQPFTEIKIEKISQ